MVCKKCRSDAISIVWSWSRKEKGTIGSGESLMEFDKFISRSTRYKCMQCGYSFLSYSTKEGLEKDSNEHVCNIIR